MAGFLYFLPEKGRGIKLPEIRDAGLGYTFDSPPTPCEVLADGPGGGPGVVLADEKRLKANVGYYPGKQKWRKVPGSAAWIGYYVDFPMPGPADLARESRFLTGHPVTLGDDNDWIIPVARAWSEDESGGWYCRLPETIDWDEEGKRTRGDVVPQYAALWDAASKWFDAKSLAKLEERRAMLTVVLTNDLALVGLGTNYAVGKAEAGLLHLLDDRNEIQVLDAMIDWPTWSRYFAKKNAEAAAGSSTADGPAAVTVDTALVSPISTPLVSTGS